MFKNMGRNKRDVSWKITKVTLGKIYRPLCYALNFADADSASLKVKRDDHSSSSSSLLMFGVYQYFPQTYQKTEIKLANFECQCQLCLLKYYNSYSYSCLLQDMLKYLMKIIAYANLFSSWSRERAIVSEKTRLKW